MSVPSYDVVVVGAGIVGAACADECARRGMRVALMDRDIVAGGTTGAGMGHIVVMDDSEAQFALTRYSQLLWQELLRDLPPSVEYDQCGTIWVAADDDEMSEVRRKHAYYNAHDVPAVVLESADLEDAEPRLRKGLAGGLLVPEDGVLYPPSAARFLIDRALYHGAKLILGVVVTGIGNGRVQTAEGSEFSAAVIVNAAGAWAPILTPGLPIKRRKGHLAITDRYAGFVRHQLVELGYLKSAHALRSDSVAFNAQPRRTGQILIGSSRQYGSESNEVERDIVSRMLHRAQEYMPSLAALSVIRMWTGFRAATPDKVPLIGRWPADSTVFLATGHEGLGITTSLGTARLLLAQILGEESDIPIDPYLPARPLKENVHA